MFHERPGPYRDAERYIRGKREWAPLLLPPDRPGVRPPAELDGTSRALASALWPRIRDRYPTVVREDVLPACWSLAAMGYTLDDLDEALWALELLGRYGQLVSSLDIREAVRVLGSQADIFLETLTTGLHQETTGTGEFPVALWEHQTYMALTVDGAARMRELRRLPQPPRELVDRERRKEAEHANTLDCSHEPFRHKNGDVPPNRCRRL